MASIKTRLAIIFQVIKNPTPHYIGKKLSAEL